MTSSVSWSFTTSYQPGSAYTLWGNSVKPTIVSANDSNPIEVGVMFESSVAGSIAGIRFYDGNPESLDSDGDTSDTYVVHLWTVTGTLLATANYTLNDDSSLGWQQANFTTPVSIAANTVYVASYYAPEGGYAEDVGYFENSGVTSGPLHALSATEVTNLSNSASTGNGVYVEGTGGGFPTSTYAGTNYWVDVAFNVGTGVAPPPSVTAQTPAAGATGVSTALSAISATFNEPVNPNSISVAVTDASGNSVTGLLSYNSSTNTIVFTPNNQLGVSTKYTVTVGGATDSLGHSMTAPVSWSFTTAATPTYTVFPNTATPAISSVGNTAPQELGVKFESAVPGYIAGIRFYKGSGNNGTHVGYLYTSTGTLLASATFTNESAAGWQAVDFSSPVAIAADTVYIASYYAPDGDYSANSGYFASSGVSSGPLTALSNTAAGGNGVYSAGDVFPTSSFNAGNYWVDVDFNPGNVNTPPPTVTAQTPASGTTGVSTLSAVSATFSEPVQSGTFSFSFTLKDSSGNAVSGSVSYNATTDTATFTPAAALATSTQYTATVSGATDFYDHTMTAPVSWSFTTSAQPTYTLWNGAATPAVASVSDVSPDELGVKFESAVPGYIVGIRFYKGSSNTGTHVGHLYTSTGTLLATATFTGESASGWEQVTFTNPVAIAINTVYIASYFAPNGGYAADGAYFASSGVTSGPLTALSNAAAGGNGVYAYGGGFPASTYNATNYWVDVVFNPANVNTPPPTVTAQTPASGATNVSTLGSVSATFSEAVQPGTISLTLASSSGNTVNGSVSYNATTNTATFTPNTTLATSTQYTATVSGAMDYYDHTMTAPVSWSFTTSATATYTLFSNAEVPSIASVNDSNAQELGVKFESTQPGYITGIRFYKGTTNTGTHVGHLWTSTGTLLATATFTNETASGWQQVTFANPVAIAMNTVYVASYYAPNGDYAADGAYFASSGASSGPLLALSNAAASGNGVYVGGTGGGFPTNSYNATNYWVDVLYNPGSTNTLPPTVTAQAPASAAVGVSTITPISVTFSEAVQPSTIFFTLTDSSGNTVNGSVSYNATTNTATFTPNTPLAISTKYTATVSGATDYYGNALTPSPVSWLFTTAATATYTLFSNAAVPSIASVNDSNAQELGVKFESTQPGYITGIRFYKGTTNTGTHVGHLWTSTGTLLATATFTNETASGWQQVTFANPVAIAMNTVYVASYYAPNGDYAADGAYFASSGASSGPLLALSNAAASGNGVYVGGTGGGFPTNSYNATNYWVDVVFNPGKVNTPPPTVTAQAPASAAVGVSTVTLVSATFSEPVQPGTISLTLASSSGNTVNGSVSYNATTNTATFTPNTTLATSTQYTATVSGATDDYGNALTAPVSWSFTTAAGAWTQSTLAVSAPAPRATRWSPRRLVAR